jgi:Gamma interferon inducible lysosomal thiol reductase (GILT)
VVDEHYTKDPIETINFMLCTFFQNDWRNISDAANYCVNEHIPTADWGRVDECARSQLSIDILKKYEERVNALNVTLTHVPWVIIDGKHDQLGEKDLIQDICDRYYPSEKPDACIPEKLIPVGIYYETMSPEVQFFIEENVNPAHSVINQIAELDLIPYGLTQRTVIDGVDNFTCAMGNGQCEANMYHVS